MKNLINGKLDLRKKLLLLYLIAAVIPTLIITIMISTVYYRNILENAYSLIEQNNKIHETLVQERLQSYENALYEMVVDPTYLDMARMIRKGDPSQTLATESQMKQVIQSRIYTYNDVRSIAFLADNSRGVSYSKGYGSLYDSIWSDENQRDTIRNIIEASDDITYIAPVNLRTDKVGTDYVILLGFPIRNLHTKEMYGVFVVAVDSSILMLDYSSGDWKTSAVTTMIVDEQDKILAGLENDWVNLPMQQFLETTYEKRDLVLSREWPIDGTRWKIVNLIQRSIYRKEIFSLISTVILFIILISILFCVIVIYYTRGYLRNIETIAEEIRNYDPEPDRPVEIAMDEKDELYQIVRQFRAMTERIRILVEELKQKNTDIRMAADRQRHAEIKALEAQINPHFLFNTLDSINWRAIENDEEEISNMLSTLGSLLRYSISNIDMLVLLEAEIEWLKKYIFLQRDRFNNSFDCTYQISPEALNFPIYKMLLQPIIENAILHAFEEIREGGIIEFCADILEDGRLRISIRDNGSGIQPEVLEEIRREIREKSALNSDRIGISNIINRLWVYYQDAAELFVNSVPGEGSEFILLIPDLQQHGYVHEDKNTLNEGSERR